MERTQARWEMSFPLPVALPTTGFLSFSTMDIGGLYPLLWASQVAPVVKKPTCHCKRHKRHGFDPWVRKIPRRREWQPTPVFLAGESHGQRSLAGSSSWGCKESGTTEVT